MLSSAELRRRYPEAFVLKPWIYWLDMLASAVVGWGAFVLALRAPMGSTLSLVSLIVAVLVLYRGVLFIHEIAHIKRGALPGFETTWNLLFGFPLLVPSLMYVGPHMVHHRAATYGTAEDPEYAPIASWPPLEIGLKSASMLAVPALLAIRWGLLTLASRLIPPLRPWVVGKTSTLVINTEYTRPDPTPRERGRWLAQESGAALYVWALVGGTLLGSIPWQILGTWYLTMAAILTVNHVRTLAAHRYENQGTRMDATSQLLDSVNVAGLWTGLLAPVGLRFHALHHLAPALPYHSLAWLHRRLMAELPEDSPYRRAEAAGVLTAVRELFVRAATRNRGPTPTAG